MRRPAMRRRSVETEIALVFLGSRPKMTVVAAVGVVFGIGVYIFMNSLLAGSNAYMEKVTLMLVPHLRIYQDDPSADEALLGKELPDGSIPVVSNPGLVPADNRVRNPFSLLAAVRRDPAVVAAAPVAEARATVSSGAVERGATLDGVDILEHDRMFGISSTLVEGSLKDLAQGTDGIVLGAVLAADLHLHAGDPVSVSVAGREPRRFRVAGIFRTTVKGVDKGKAYANLPAVQQLLGKDRSYVTDLYANVADEDEGLAEVADRFRRTTGLRVETWQEANEQSLAGRRIRDVIANSAVFTILLVAGFGIYNILNMTIHEKIKEIAILKATGFTGRHVVGIFVRQSALIGLAGSVGGILFGFLLSSVVGAIPLRLGGLDTLPMAYRTVDYAVGFLFGIGTALVAGLVPAVNAAKVDPVAIIRG